MKRIIKHFLGISTFIGCGVKFDDLLLSWAATMGHIRVVNDNSNTNFRFRRRNIVYNALSLLTMASKTLLPSLWSFLIPGVCISFSSMLHALPWPLSPLSFSLLLFLRPSYPLPLPSAAFSSAHGLAWSCDVPRASFLHYRSVACALAFVYFVIELAPFQKSKTASPQVIVRPFALLLL